MDPDGYCIIHHRMNDTLYFGPFSSLEDAKLWSAFHPQVQGPIIPLYRDVDWNRNG